jgi:hypothetical protein
MVVNLLNNLHQLNNSKHILLIKKYHMVIHLIMQIMVKLLIKMITNLHLKIIIHLRKINK